MILSSKTDNNIGIKFTKFQVAKMYQIIDTLYPTIHFILDHFDFMDKKSERNNYLIKNSKLNSTKNGKIPRLDIQITTFAIEMQKFQEVKKKSNILYHSL